MNATIRIYALASSDAIGGAIQTVDKAIRAQFGIVSTPRLEVAIHPGNGFIDAWDRQELWERTRAPTLPSRAEAEARARSFLAGLAGRLDPLARGDTRLVFLPPLPSRPLELLAIPSLDGKRWDHWLYRTQPRLTPAPGQRSLAVFGAQVEVRVGHAGQIIGYCARWRPITAATRNVAMTPWQPSTEEHGYADTNTDRNSEPARAYVLEGGAVPQLYLAPYYLATNGHHFQFVSASNLSMVIAFELDDDDESTSVTAHVLGGSGKYDFVWAAAPLGDPLAERVDLDAETSNYRAGPELSTVHLPKGAWGVAVNVVDRVTGGFKHHQEQVFSSPFAVRGQPSFVILDDKSRKFVEHTLAPPPVVEV